MKKIDLEARLHLHFGSARKTTHSTNRKHRSQFLSVTDDSMGHVGMLKLFFHVAKTSFSHTTNFNDVRNGVSNYY